MSSKGSTATPRHEHPLLPKDLADEFRRKGYWEGITLAEIVEEWASKDPERVAVVGPHPLTYSELWEQARRVAGALEAGGHLPAECIVAVLSNSWQGVVLEVAASVRGALFCPRSAHASPTLIVNLFEQLDGRALVIDAKLLAQPEWREAFVTVQQRIGERPVMLVGAEGELDGLEELAVLEDVALTGPLAAPVEPDPSQPCLVLSTGGTTGIPKSILHASEALVYAVRHFGRAVEFTENDTHVGFAPYGHAGGSVFDIYMPLLHGARVLPLSRWEARSVGEAISQYGGTFFVTMGTHVFDLLKLDGDADELFRSVRLITSGAGPDQLYVDGEERFGFKIVRVYGCGECPGHAIGRPSDPAEIRLHEDGIPFAGVEYRRVDLVTGEEVGAGEAGEYQCRGPNLFLGYAGQSELTSDAVTGEGFYRSGDLMTESDSGYLSWAGRTKEIIRRGGIQIDPLEIETILATHRAISEIVVVGAPDPRMGERAVAVAVAVDVASQPELGDLCDHLLDAGLPKANLPERVVYVEEIPRTDVGKFHRVEVKRLIADLDRTADTPA